jgi:excisionase family DNA binding protein
MTLDELRQRVTISLWPEAGELLGISKNSSYAAAKAGEIPVLRLGNRYRVSAPALLRLLADDGAMTFAAKEETPAIGVDAPAGVASPNL